MQRRRKITAEQLAEMRRLREEGKTNRVISELLDIPCSTVTKYTAASSHLSRGHIHQIRLLHRAGATQQTLAKQFGVTPATIAKYTTKSEPITPQAGNAEVVKAIQKGFADAEIASAFSCDARYVAELRQAILEVDKSRQDVERWLQQELRDSARGLYSTGNDKP